MKGIKRFFRTIFLLIVIFVSVIFGMGYQKYKSAVELKPFEEAVSAIRGIENYTLLSEVPDIYKDAVIAVEDRRFYKHGGFDIIGTGRALVSDVKEKKLLEGGSTITQQLMKNMYFPKDRSPIRKIAEIIAAVNFEREYSKDEILEFYINGIYYGSGYYNIHDAAWGYFEKAPSDMTDNEATLLAGVPNAPSVYSPKVDPELCKKRQKKVISCMVDCGYIDKTGADIILEEVE